MPIRQRTAAKQRKDGKFIAEIIANRYLKTAAKGMVSSGSLNGEKRVLLLLSVIMALW
jgi:hypothetical protein